MAAADKDPKKDPPEKDPDPDKGPTADELTAMRAALKKANGEAEAARLKLKELEDKDKPDLERLANEVKEANERATKAENRAMRLDVAVAKKLTPAQANRLVGATKEELEADADEFLKEIGGANTGDEEDDDKGNGSKDDRGPASTRPKPDLKGGSDPTGKEPVELDPAKLAASVPRQ